MPLLAYGLNHHTAPIGVREKLSFVPQQLQSSLISLSDQAGLNEVVILSTCNRTEFYCPVDAEAQMLQWLCQRQQCAPADLQPYLYTHKEEAAVKHILRVASGLDSMVLGEPQILGQMKDAFSVAAEAGTIGPQLQRLFQYVFSVSKQIRTRTGIGANPVSVAYTAVNLAKSIFTDLASTSVMMIGTGETSELAIRYLTENQVKDIVIVNRTYQKAQQLAEKYRGKAATFSNMADLLPHVDIVITATNSTVPVLGKGTVERALKQRKQQPMFMVDLAVPRDIEPEVAELKDVHLYCIDDLQQVIEKSLQDRRQAAQEAEQIINLQVEHYMRWLRSLDSVDIIRSFRSNMESIRDQEIKNAQQLLQQGHSPEATLCILARNLTNKFMHIPTTQMRQAGYEQDLEQLALLRETFCLDD